ncbi:MAG: hypothetical protein Q9164_001021 [Protoblastenia rupestris]
MNEAGEGIAKLERMTPDTFQRFIEWAYKGYYRAPAPSLDGKEISAEDNVREAVYNGNGGNGVDWEVAECETSRCPVSEPEPVPLAQPPSDIGLRKKATNGKQKYYEIWGETSVDRPPSPQKLLKESFINRKPTVRRTTIAIPPAAPNQNANENYVGVFLCHAQLYVFAEGYDIQELKTLALEELHATLAIFTLHRRRTADIIELLRYVYCNTTEPVWGGEELRAVLTQYIGFEMDTLMKDSNFRDIMIEDGGDMLADFMSMVARRIR